jgi:ABC-2 type transport system ATP-binding protein
MSHQIVVRNLRKQFPKVLAVAGVDLDIAAGEVFGLLGPNGAGQTTTLEMIEGLTQPDSGEIEVCGLSWRQHASAIRARIGVQLQATSLYNKITPREALDQFGSYYPKRRSTGRAAQARPARGQGRRLPRDAVRRPGAALALALALVNDPEVVFLDEPTAGLDPQGPALALGSSCARSCPRPHGDAHHAITWTRPSRSADRLAPHRPRQGPSRSGTPAELIASLGIRASSR